MTSPFSHLRRHTLLVWFAAIAGLASAQNLPQLGKSPLPEVVAAMTVEEKVDLVVGGGMNLPGLPGPMGANANLTDAQKRVMGAAGTVVGVPRLGIPSLVVCDGPAGVHPFASPLLRPYYATAWPIGTMLASSWDTTLVKKVGTTFGKEAKEYGIDILLAPGMNIHRNPLGGRNFEYYSEDPYVTGHIAAAMVNGIQSNGVGVSAKHFIANNQETNRNTVDVVLSERTLREIYLRGWQIMVKKSNPWTLMSSYNLVNGTMTSQNPELLTTVLRKEWGFKGIVMTDWFGGRDAVANQKAGNHLIMPGRPDQKKAILAALQNGTLEMKQLDQNVAEILQVIMLSPTYNQYKFSDHPDLKKNAQVAREAAAESMVLLKNNNALPVAPGTVALFGNSGYELIAGGTGSGETTRFYTVALSEGLYRAGYNQVTDLYLNYTRYLEAEAIKHPKKSMFEEFMNPSPPIDEYAISTEAINRAVASADHIIVAIGRNAGEGTDRKLEGNYRLTDTERSLIQRASEAAHSKGKKLIVTLNIPAPIDMLSWRDQADAILLAWQPGIEGGNAIVDVISGKVNPSGKLATTFPAKYEDDPTAKNFPGVEFKDKPLPGQFGGTAYETEVKYEEGVYMGYRYYNTFGVEPAYPFGFGLSYTHFNYGDVKLSAPAFTDKITATITITNDGKAAGKEVVQLYLSAPTNKLDKPAAELKGFAKTKLLAPGESQTLVFTLTPAELASYLTKASAWVADAGTYTVRFGTAQQTWKSATFKLAKEIVVEKTNKVIVPRKPITDLVPPKK